MEADKEREKVVKYCPFCGEPDEVYYVGELEDGKEVYRCERCDTYFLAVELKPPFTVKVTE